jgi:hypothetical protein
MVAITTSTPYSPTYPGDQGGQSQMPRDETARWVNDRTRDLISQAGPWLGEASVANRYYRSDQGKRSAIQEKNRVRLVANFIRRDVDLMVSEVLDGKPVVNPSGRHPKFHELGRLLMNVHDWSREEEENWEANQERVITQCFHIGEGVLFEGWDQDADEGMGRPVCKYIDSRYLFWDDESGEDGFQRDDAREIIWLESSSVEDAERQYPEMEGRVQPETMETFLTPHLSNYNRFQNAGATGGRVMRQLPADQRVWIRRCWRKKKSFAKRYFFKSDGLPAIFEEEDGRDHPLTEAEYDLLPSEEQDDLVCTRHLRVEMWETVVINETTVENRISPFCRTRGGHGHYPFCFFSYVHLADEARARGEIGFLVSSQDITNETITLFLDQLFLNNVGYWQVFKGSLPPEEREKVNRIGSSPHMVIETQQGVDPPRHVGTDSNGMHAASNALPVIKDVMDKISGVQDVDRGMPEGLRSGRAIRALQARTSLLATKVRRHIESGLRRATLLRLHNIMQFMRGSRVIEVTDPNTRAEKPLYIGHSEEEILNTFKLKPEIDHESKSIKVVNREGTEVEILVLNDEVARNVLVEKIKLTLDTGQERNKLERMDQAEMVLQTVGPAAIPWAGQQLDWSNLDQLLDDIDKADSKNQVFSQLEKISKETKVPLEDLISKVMEQAQSIGAASEGAEQLQGAAA